VVCNKIMSSKMYPKKHNTLNFINKNDCDTVRSVYCSVRSGSIR